MTAIKIKDVSEKFAGMAWLYKLDVPLEGYTYVVASAASVMFTGAETYIFGTTPSGKVTDWVELDGSFEGAMDCDQAIRNAGYNIVDGPPVKEEERC